MAMSQLPSDEDGRSPLYAEICRFYIAEIAAGTIAPGDLLPPAHRVASQHGTSISTARRGLRLLAQIGWAKPVPGYPYLALRPDKA
jgi:DNA-binding GntR family transcriptional regulator